MRWFSVLSAAVLLLAQLAGYGGSGAFLGVAVGPLNVETLHAIGVTSGGAHVTEVLEGGAAQVAGILRHDVILRLAGDRICSPRHLQELVRTHAPGDRVAVEIWRAGNTCTLAVTLGKPDAPVEMLKSVAGLGSAPGAWLGLQLSSAATQAVGTSRRGDHDGTMRGPATVGTHRTMIVRRGFGGMNVAGTTSPATEAAGSALKEGRPTALTMMAGGRTPSSGVCVGSEARGASPIDTLLNYGVSRHVVHCEIEGLTGCPWIGRYCHGTRPVRGHVPK